MCNFFQSTFDPVFIRERNHFFDTIGFACSENCACGGKCTNNITLLPEKNINKFEIYRKNEIMGFAIRTLNSIPAGKSYLTDDQNAIFLYRHPSHGVYWRTHGFWYLGQYRSGLCFRNSKRSSQPSWDPSQFQQKMEWKFQKLTEKTIGKTLVRQSQANRKRCSHLLSQLSTQYGNGSSIPKRILTGSLQASSSHSWGHFPGSWTNIWLWSRIPEWA